MEGMRRAVNGFRRHAAVMEGFAGGKTIRICGIETS